VSTLRWLMWLVVARSIFVRRFAVACVVVTLVAGAGVALIDRYGQREFARRTVIHLANGVLAPGAPAKPANYLLLGDDTTGKIEQDVLPDTMMVLHVDPAVRIPLLVSFPRDLIVNIPGHGTGQLNAAYGYGGANLLIRTLTSDFGFPINHYLLVDFSGFEQIVNAIGHVKVWFPTPMHDPYVGLNVDQTGCKTLNGVEALAYARSRHYFVPDNISAPVPWSWNYAPGITKDSLRGGRGWVATGSDIDRIPRQQYFLRTVAQAAINKTNDDPLRLIDLVDAIVRHLTTDQTLKYGELKALVRTFQGLKPADVAMTTLPWKTDPADNARVLVKYPDATAILDQLATFTPPKPFIPTLVKANTVRVRVVNGSGVPGIAQHVLNLLVAAGFRSAGPAVDASTSNYAQTQVRWAPHEDIRGVTVVYATGAHQFGQATAAAGTLGGDVLIVVGRDWNTLRHHLAGLPGGPPTTRPTTTTPPTTGTRARTTTTPATTTRSPTTTTVAGSDPRYLPVNPKTGGILVGCPA
jgi:LCP family protein required for cell wall assembly